MPGLLIRTPSGLVTFASAVTPTKNAVDAAGTTGITVTTPSSLAIGDLLCAIIGRADDDGTTAFGNAAFMAGTNASNATGNDRRVCSAFRYVDGSEAGSYTFTNDAAPSIPMCAIMFALRGIKNGETAAGNIATNATSANTSNDFTPNAPSITPTHLGSLVLTWHVASMDNGVSGKTGGAPSGCTLIDYTEQVTAGKFGCFLEVAYQENVTGTFNPGAWTGSPNDATSEATCTTISVRPQQTWYPVQSVFAQHRASRW